MIKNVVFDIGNVLLKWEPDVAIKMALPEYDIKTLYKDVFHSPIWIDFNLGKISEAEIISICSNKYNIPQKRLFDLFNIIKESLTPVSGSFELLEKLHTAKIPLYSITDNIKEFMEFLRKKYTFWQKFIGVVVSAEVGIVKPDERIYLYLLKKYNINPTETIFIDDLEKNVEGARRVGMHAILFKDAKSCEKELKSLKLSF